MKRIALVFAAALVAALTVCAMAGCSSQSASSASASDSASASAAASDSASASEAASESASASAAAEQSQDELIAEYKEAVANIPEYKSVTVTAEESSTVTDSESGDEESIEAVTVYKFDKSGDQLKTSTEGEISGIKLKYITEGDNAVFVSDGPVYGGTAEQFNLGSAGGLEAYLNEAIGDLNTLADCASTVEKLESNGLVFYMLTLDPEKYIASDEALQMLAEYGTPVKEAFFTIGFDEDGSLGSIDQKVAYEDLTAVKNLLFSDYDSTVVEPMPEAEKTYEEMEADMQEKLDAFSEQIDMAEDLEGEAEASDAAEAK